MDISTFKVTKQKYVTNAFGVFELKYFFSEEMKCQWWVKYLTRQIKEALGKIVDEEDKAKTLPWLISRHLGGITL